VTHCIIFEPDPSCRETLEGALASLYWRSAHADSLSGVASHLPGPWAVLAAIEADDVIALEAIREMRAVAAGVVICALVDEHSPGFDAQLLEAGADTVFAKPVTETEIVEAVVAGFMARRR
jgi:DNA-binding response OmpR family regulator